MVRPAPLAVSTLAEGRFGIGIDFSVGARRLAVGYPGVASNLPAPGARRGQAWGYEIDQLFADGFKNP